MALCVFPFCNHSIYANSETLSADLFIEESSFKTVPLYPVTGKKTRLYITLSNTSLLQDMKGVVRAYDAAEKKQIEVEQSFTVLKNGQANIFLDFIPEKTGVHEISFRIIPWEEYSENKLETDKWTSKIFVDVDSDGDGAGDQWDAYPNDSTEWQPKENIVLSSPSSSPNPSEGPALPDDVFSLESARPPVVVLSQMNPFSITRGENFTINSGLSRGFLGENLMTTWQIVNNKGEILIEKTTPELTFSLSWPGSYSIRGIVTNESGISATKEVLFTVRFSWKDGMMGVGIFGLFISGMWWIWQRRKK